MNMTDDTESPKDRTISSASFVVMIDLFFCLFYLYPLLV